MSAPTIEVLSKPEYLHVLLNPLPIYGLAIGVVVLSIALALRKRAAQGVALWVLVFSAASSWPVLLSGESAYHEMYLLADNDGKSWLDTHRKRAERWIYVLYALSVASLGAALIPARFPKTSFLAVILTWVLGIVSLVIVGRIAHAGGKIRHPEFRHGQSAMPGSNREREHGSKFHSFAGVRVHSRLI